MRALKYVIIAAVIVVAGVIVCWNLAPGWITSELSKMMGVEFTIGHLGVGFDSVSANNLRIANPKGYKFRDALRVREMRAETSIFRLFHKDIVIDRLEGNNIYIDLEFDRRGSTSGNWTVIMGNLEKALENDNKPSDRSVFIKYIILKDITVDLVYRRENEVMRLKPIRQVVLRNVSTKEKFPLAQLTSLIMKQLLREIFSIQNLGNMLKNILEPGQGNGFVDVFQGIFSIDVDFDPDELMQE